MTPFRLHSFPSTKMLQGIQNDLRLWYLEWRQSLQILFPGVDGIEWWILLTMFVAFFGGLWFGRRQRQLRDSRRFPGHFPDQPVRPILDTAVDEPDEEEDEDSEEEEPWKMVLVIRTDLPMTKGKVAAQCCHACLAAYEDALPSKLKPWQESGSAKVTLKCNSEPEMLALQMKARERGLTAVSICDAGRTQLEPGSRTVLAIGPAPARYIDEVTGHLKLY